MRRVFQFLTVAVLVLASMACTHKELEYRHDGSVALQVRGGVSSVATKADGGAWTADDQVGVRVASPVNGGLYGSYQNVGYVNAASGTSTSIFSAINDDIYFNEDDETTEYYFTAYSPYEATDADALPGVDGVIEQSTLDQSDPTVLDFLYAAEAGPAGYDAPTVNLSFYHKMSQIIINITAGYGVDPSELEGITLALCGLVHQGEFSVLTGVAAITSATAEDLPLDSTTPTPTNTTADLSYQVIVYPQDINEFVLAGTLADGREFIGDLTVDATWNTFDAGYSYVYNFEIRADDNRVALVATGWTINDWNYDYTWSGSATITPPDEEETPGGDEQEEPGDDGDETDENAIDLSTCTETSYTVTENCTLTTSGDPYTGQVTITGDATEVTFKGLNINSDISSASGGGAALTISTTNDLTITLSGENVVDITYTSGTSTQWECVLVNKEITLTIEGTDGDTLTLQPGTDVTDGNNKSGLDLSKASLVVNGGHIISYGHYNYPAIGAGQNSTCGDITVNGGIVDAQCAGLAAAIGSGNGGTCGNITITGGTVNASCENGNGSGIGAGNGGTCGKIIITGGTVNAVGRGGSSTPIGTCGQNAASTCGDIIITSGVTSVTTRSDGDNAPTYQIGPGTTSCTVGSVYLGGADANDTSVATWTPKEGQFNIAGGVYGWTLADGTWTKE